MPEKDKEIHIRISKIEKKRWKEYFKKEGHTISSGIRARINKEIRDTLLNRDQEKEKQIFISPDQVNFLMEQISDLNDKIKTLESLGARLPEPIIIEDFNKFKLKIKQKLNEYGPLSTLSLSDLLEIPGPILLTLMEKIKNEPDSEVSMNEDFEWCVKKSE